MRGRIAKTRVGDLSLAYDDLGTGPRTLLLMPGWCESRTVYAPFAQLARRHYRVLRFDWRGHGDSTIPDEDFGTAELLEDALAVLDAAHVERVTVLAIAHASWVAVELCRKHPTRVEGLVFMDWVFTSPPSAFAEAVAAFGDTGKWEETRESLFDLWLAGTDNPIMVDHIRGDLARLGFDMWRRAGREILGAYQAHGSPMQMLQVAPPGVPCRHIYALNREGSYLAAQQQFAQQHPWFMVRRLESRTHLPVLEVPHEVLREVQELQHWLDNTKPN
jgi:pimeloyl-ACP methyl ester carboxylesterase